MNKNDSNNPNKNIINDEIQEINEIEKVIKIVKEEENPHKDHRKRMRNRYMNCKLDGFADHEVLEFLLFYAIPRKNTNKLAHRILSEFSSLSNLFESHPREIMKRCGISENVAVLISLGAPLAKRYNASRWATKKFFRTTEELSTYAKSLFVGEEVECIYLLCFDSKLQLVHPELVERGTINKAGFYTREIMRKVLGHHAVYVVMAHNHPSGDPELSKVDTDTTWNVKRLLESVAIYTIDHLVVAGDEVVSMAKKRILGLKGIEGVLKELENP